MDWVPLADYEMGLNMDDRPRKLTTEEIAYISSHIPIAPSADSTAAEVARQGIIDWMVESLSEAHLCPSAIPELIEIMVKQHHKSLIAPGTPVGIAAAEAVGATTTQMTLNSVSPDEMILVQDFEGDIHLLKIGKWIDELLENDRANIVNIPSNRTQYLELKDPVYIASPDENGKVVWSLITAVTKHEPIGDLVKITTKTGREATVTRTKSLLVWNGKKLVQRNGASVAVGDQVPVFANLPEAPIKVNETNDVNTLLGSHDLVASRLKMALNEYGSLAKEAVELHINLLTHESAIIVSVLCSRLGIISEIRGETCVIGRSQITKWSDRVGFDHKHIRQYMEWFQEGLLTKEHEQVNDVVLDPIVSIEQVPATEFVYDLTVPETTNFSLWNGLGIADTFHTSGSAKSASFGIDSMRDLIFARKNPKNESCTIYYNNKRATYEQILDSRHYIVGSVVSDFIKDYDIDAPENLERYWWHDQAEVLLDKQLPNSTKVLRLFLNVPEMYKQHVSIKDLADVLEREVPPTAVAVYGPISDGIIDFYPHPTIIQDTLKGREKGAIPLKLAELTYLESVVVPELKKIRVKGISGIRNLVPVVSPVWRMVMHERKLLENDLPTDPEGRARLTPGVTDRNGWLLFYNPTIMRTTGLTGENLAALCQLAGATILGTTRLWLAITLPNDRFRTQRGDVVLDENGIKYRLVPEVIRRDGIVYREILPSNVKEEDGILTEKVDEKVFDVVPPQLIWRVDDKIYRQIPNNQFIERNGVAYEQIVDPKIVVTELKPNEYVANKVSNDKSMRQMAIKRLSDEMIREAQGLPEDERRALLRRPINIPRTALMTAAEFVYAETEGSNLKELLALPNIDKTRTTCNNMYTITNTLGIEAARTFVIRALSNTIANTGSYVHPANITLIAEFITSRGEPYGATYTGISRQPGGHLSLATLERAGKVFTQNALHGRKEDIRNVSASIAVGARMAIGDGSFDIAQDISENGVTKTIVNDDLFDALSRDDETKQLLAQYTPTTANVTTDQTIAAEDLIGGIDMIKNITLGGTFDHVGSEDEVNLLTLFTPGEAIPEIAPTRPVQQGAPTKVVRRVQAQPVQPQTAPKIDVPRDLVDVLTQIKVGVPLTDGQEALTIGPIEAIPVPEQPDQPVLSAGLIPLDELFAPRMETGFPQQLQALFDEYEAEQAITMVPEELPRIDVPQLPDLTGADFNRIMLDLRREQVRGLEAVDIDALQEALNQ